MTGSKCLLVEDEYLIRLTLAELLADEGFEVLEAGTAEDALGLLVRNPDVGLLLTDIQLPGSVDGITLVRRARERMPSLPVIYMTGRGSLAAEPGDNEIVLAKPFLPSDVCAAAHRLTRR
jgi:DNA-binding response OmpR family regulator